MTESNEWELPDGWVWARLPDLIGPDGVFSDGDWVESKDQDPSGNVRLIQLADIGIGTFRDRSERFLTAEKASDLRCTYLERGDVLIARMPDPLGRACIFPGVGQPAVTVVDVCIVRPGAAIVSARWLMHMTNTPAISAAVARYQSGSTRKRISRKNLGKIPFPVPPLPEQHRIVDKIEELFSDLDAGEAALEKTERLLERYRQSILKAAVEGELTREWREQNPDAEPAAVLLERILEERRARWEADQLAKYEAKGKKPPKGWKDRYKPPVKPDTSDLPKLPEGWRWTSVDELAEVTGGLTQNAKRKALKLQMPFLRVANVYANELRLQDVQEIGVKPSEVDRALLRRGDLLVVEGNGSVDQIGRVARWDGSVDPCLHQNHLIKVRSILAELGRLLLHWLLSPSGRHHIVRVASSTSGLHTLSLSKISAIAVPLPPLSEQEIIVEEVERRLSVVDAVALEIGRQRGRAKQLRRAILKDAFEGKLVPQEPKDEPSGTKLKSEEMSRNGKLLRSATVPVAKSNL